MADASMIKYNLGKFGYTFFEIAEKNIVDNLIIEIIKNKKKRYMKAIPFIIYQSYTESSKKPYLNMKNLYMKSMESNLIREVNAMLYITSEIFIISGDREDMIRDISKYLEEHSSEKEINIFEIIFKNKEGTASIEFEDYAKNDKINWIDFGEFLNDFMMHKSLRESHGKKTLKESIEISHNRDILIYLSRLFSPKQREIIEKIINEKPLDKTEYEYYIRIIKKRLNAIAELKKLAETAMGKRPKRAQIDNK
ncbi:MAG: hypothetical protein KAS04_01610 [Candidatus Aenigmarchaeota archaeon]|nr:hypothetical protein [Candidatus Aenigmarchaeota archaeon]